MRVFRPSDPFDTYRSQVEIENWKTELDEKKASERKADQRYRITTGIAILTLVVSIIALAVSILK